MNLDIQSTPNTRFSKMIGGNMITWGKIVPTTIFASRLQVVNYVRWSD